MPEYTALRFVLAVLCLVIAIRGPLLYFAFAAFALLVPPNLYSHSYWVWVWLPLEFPKLVCAIALTLWLMFKYPPLHAPAYTVAIAMAGAVISMPFFAPVTTIFPAALQTRQYAYIVLFLMSLSLWRRGEEFARLWILWLGISALMASTGENGLLWHIAPGLHTRAGWRVVGDLSVIALALTAFAMIGALRPLPDLRGAARSEL